MMSDVCDKAPEPESGTVHYVSVTDKISAKPIPPRAIRLNEEASNCLTIAVRQTDRSFAGDLIDEALRLAKRARELAD